MPQTAMFPPDERAIGRENRGGYCGKTAATAILASFLVAPFSPSSPFRGDPKISACDWSGLAQRRFPFCAVASIAFSPLLEFSAGALVSIMVTFDVQLLRLCLLFLPFAWRVLVCWCECVHILLPRTFPCSHWCACVCACVRALVCVCLCCSCVIYMVPRCEKLGWPPCSYLSERGSSTRMLVQINFAYFYLFVVPI